MEARERQPAPMGRVAVVTDSTAYLPTELVREHDLTVVPLLVVLGGRSLAEGVDVTSDDVAAALVAHTPVTTSRPAPALFAQAYRDLAAAGATGVVSIHLSGDLSGTVAGVRAAAAEVACEIEVHVVDARALGMGLGFPVLAAVRAARSRRSAAEVAEVAARASHATHTWLYVDTLEYLRRGGRIGAAQAFLGSALAVKPLLTLVDGRLEPLERVRTTSRALDRLVELVAARAGGQPVDLAVHHLAAKERADLVAERLGAAIPNVRTLVVAEVGAVVGAHVGPGMLAVILSDFAGD
jgi:DegV family protein with EDD domain